MQNGFYQATGAMVTQLNRLNVISNNLANVNTAGFKKDNVVIADFKRLYDEEMQNMPIDDNTRQAAKYINQTINRVPNIDIEYTDFSVGAIRPTNNPLDIAIKRSDCFFMVRSADGQVKFTKNGAFSLDEDGFIVTKDGERLLSSNYFDDPVNDGIQVGDGQSLNIDRDGNVYLDGEVANRIFVARMDDTRDLEKIGDNLYKLDDLTKMQDFEGSNALASGFLEMSNVNAVNEMVGLIETHRLVEMYQKVMTSHMDDVNSDAINKLANVK